MTSVFERGGASLRARFRRARAAAAARTAVRAAVASATRRIDERGARLGDDLREGTLSYLAACRVERAGAGRYALVPGGRPLLYASCYAALLLDLCGQLEALPVEERAAWADYLAGHQSPDGLFRDPEVACASAETLEWWGWRHMTLHVLMAMGTLGSVPERRLVFLDGFRARGAVRKWVAARRWEADPGVVSNEIQNIGTALQFARDEMGEEWAGELVDELLDALDERARVHGPTWCASKPGRVRLSGAVQTAYHLWMLYFYDGRAIPFPAEALRLCLATENEFGGFGAVADTSACEDIDTIHPLAWLGLEGCSGAEPVTRALRLAVPWVVSNFNADGGACFRRSETLVYGSEKMTLRGGESNLFATWFRALSLAYVGEALADSPVRGAFAVRRRVPGHQFPLRVAEGALS